MQTRSRRRRFLSPAVAAEVLDSRLLLSAQFAPQGSFDGISAGHVVHGWVVDRDVPGQPIGVHIHIDGQHVGTTITRVARPDVVRETGIAGNHGFRWQIPAEFLDGAAHTVEVFDIDPQGQQNTRLRNSGRPLGAEIEVTGVGDGQDQSVSLGTVDQFGRRPERTFTITNTGNVVLTLGRIELLNNRHATSIEVTRQPAAVVQPGQTTQFTVRLTRTDFAGTFHARVQFQTNDSSESTFNFTASATVRALESEVSVDGVTDGQNSAINLGSVDQESSVPSRTFTIRNTGRGPLTVREITLSDPAFVVTRAPSSTVAANGSTTFTVALRNTATAGTFNATLSFTTNDADERTFDFPITATVRARLPEIGVDGVTDGQSAAVDLGTVNQDGSAPSQTFTIRNTGVGTLTLGQITLSNSAFEVTRQPSAAVAPNTTTTFTVRLRSTVIAGEFTSSVSFATNDTDEATFNFPVSATVRSTQPEIEVSIDGRVIAPDRDGLLDFRAVFQGSGRQKAILVHNTGARTLTLSQYESSAEQTLFSRPTTIQPGGSASIQVSFSTTTLGLREGTIQFRTNDADEPIIRINTRGKVFAVPTFDLQTRPTHLADGIHDILDTRVTFIEIEPPSGRVPFGTAYVVRTTDAQGQVSVRHFDASLTRIVAVVPAETVFEDWTDSITITRRGTGVSPRSSDSVFADVDSLAERLR